ncbi:hypothetical protein [Chryseobacterium sp. 2987]|uniref:hypothetical protein n=1 Tax=Chryseobacterium sp. 2987 TaxID=2817767 RepID=UPI00285D2920|nr:hypothetical protein [Chryseobacterium sp. 2987]MDR6920202.1 hypothetical protein [Chryseobacterium sp. 2987]
MKKSLLAVVLSGTLFLSSCANDEQNLNDADVKSNVENTVQMKTLDSFTSDEKVIGFFKNEKNFMEKAQNSEDVFALDAEETLDDKQDKFYTVFNTSETEFHNYVQTQRQLIHYIEEEYHLSELEGAVRAELITQVIEQIYPEISVTFSDCRGVYIAKLALNASVAYGAHVACLTADVTIVVGALCHSAVLVGQAAANYIALDEYRTCVKNNG